MNKTSIPRGEESFVFVNGSAKGCLWQGIYQFEGTVFWKEKSVVLGWDEWRKIESQASKLEMVKGVDLLRSISIESAREAGREISTPNGPRWAISLDAWTEPDRINQ